MGDSEWVKWNGGECPVKKNSLVDVKHQDGDFYIRIRAGTRGGVAEYWGHIPGFSGNIIAYRPSAPSPAKRSAE